MILSTVRAARVKSSRRKKKIQSRFLGSAVRSQKKRGAAGWEAQDVLFGSKRGEFGGQSRRGRPLSAWNRGRFGAMVVQRDAASDLRLIRREKGEKKLLVEAGNALPWETVAG